MMTLAQAYELIDGMEWVLDGVHGVLSVARRNGMTEIEHHPSKNRGMRTKAYQETRRELGDDYVTTIEPCGEEMGRIFAHVETLEPVN